MHVAARVTIVVIVTSAADIGLAFWRCVHALLFREVDVHLHIRTIVFTPRCATARIQCHGAFVQGGSARNVRQPA